MAVTLPDGTVITDDTSPTTGLKAGGHRSRFYPCLSAIATWAAQAQAWAAQAQAAAGAGGGTIFPTVNASNAGQSLIVNATGSAYVADIGAREYRNKVTNGDFQTWQRGTSFASGSAQYTADRWMFNRGAAVAGATLSQASYSLGYLARLQRDNGNAALNDLQMHTSFETVDIVKYAGKQMTLSFVASAGANFSAALAALNVAIYWGTGTDSNLSVGFTSGALLLNTTVTLSATLTRYSTTVTIPSNATQLALSFGYVPVGTAGAADYAQITDVMLEEGVVMTPFPRLSRGASLLQCLRYYQTFPAWVGSSTAKLTAIINMRSTPTITGGGAGFDSTGTSSKSLICYQTTPALQTLTLSAEL